MTTQFQSLKNAAENKAIDGAVSKVTIFRIDPAAIIVEEGFNRPISREHVDALKQSIREGATIPPIHVRVDNSRIIMVDGHHRHIAVTELIVEGLPITGMDAIQFRGNDEDRVIHLLTSAQGLALSPLDAGLQYVKLRRFGLSAAKIASRIGRSVSHVHECLTLAGDGDSDVHAHVRANTVSASTASKLVRKHGSQAGAVIKQRLEGSTTGRVVADKPVRPVKPCDKCELAIYLLTKLRADYIDGHQITGCDIEEIINKLS